MQQFVKQACDTMTAALQPLQRPAGQAVHVTMADLASAADSVKYEVSKLGIMWGSSGMPSTEEARGLLSALQQSVLRLCAAFYGLSSGAGPTLQKDLSSSATAVVAACCQLVTSIIADGAPEAEVLHLVGVALARCDSAKRAPLDNRVALGRSLTRTAGAVQDACRELQELLRGSGGDPTEAQAGAEPAAAVGVAATAVQGSTGAPAPDSSTADADSSLQRMQQATARLVISEGSQAGAPANGHAAAAQDSEHGSPSERHTSPESGAGSDEADDVDFEPDELTQQGSQLVAASLQLLQALVKLLKAAIKLLLQGDPPIQATSLEAWESVVFHCASLTTSAEDLGAALYPPQDAQQVLGAAEAIHTGAELLLEDLPEPALGAEQEALQSIGEQMQAAHAAVESKAGLIDDDASQPEE